MGIWGFWCNLIYILKGIASICWEHCMESKGGSGKRLIIPEWDYRGSEQSGGCEGDVRGQILKVDSLPIFQDVTLKAAMPEI